MKHDAIESRWDEIANLIQTKWGKFSKKEVESMRGNLDDLAGKIQKVYGYARGHAEHECHQFQIALRPLLAPARNHLPK